MIEQAAQPGRSSTGRPLAPPGSAPEQTAGRQLLACLRTCVHAPTYTAHPHIPQQCPCKRRGLSSKRQAPQAGALGRGRGGAAARCTVPHAGMRALPFWKRSHHGSSLWTHLTSLGTTEAPNPIGTAPAAPCAGVWQPSLVVQVRFTHVLFRAKFCMYTC